MNIDWNKVKLNRTEVEEFIKNTSIESKVIDPLGVILKRVSDGKEVLASLPYTNGFCMHPIKCAGYNSCPRDYACSE